VPPPNSEIRNGVLLIIIAVIEALRLMTVLSAVREDIFDAAKDSLFGRGPVL
jgi:hypothetical protein